MEITWISAVQEIKTKRGCVAMSDPPSLCDHRLQGALLLTLPNMLAETLGSCCQTLVRYLGFLFLFVAAVNGTL